MQLVFRDQRLDVGKIPDLVPQRLRIDAREPRATTVTRLGLRGNHFVAHPCRDQGSFVLGMLRLPHGFVPDGSRFGAQTDRQLPRVQIDSQVQHDWFSMKVVVAIPGRAEAGPPHTLRENRLGGTVERQ